MKKITTFICGALGLACLAVAPIHLNVSASAEETVAEDITFNKNDLYVFENVVDEMPKTFSFDLQLPTSQKTAAGTLFGNLGAFFNGHIQSYPNLSDNNMSIEIDTKGMPTIYHRTGEEVATVAFHSVDVRGSDFVNLTITRDEDTVYCYLNGELKETATFEIDDFSSKYAYAVGGDYIEARTKYFKGTIRSVQIYSDYRTGEEIETAQTAVDYTDPELMVAYDLSGQAGADRIEDKSTNDNDLVRTWLFADTIEEPDYDYSIMVVGDTQQLNIAQPENFPKLYDYIVANVESQKVVHVAGLGDITEDSEDEEFSLAKENIAKLNGVVSYSVVQGNHDTQTKYVEAFGGEDSTYLAQCYDTFDDTARATAHTFSAGNLDYLLLTLGWKGTDAELAWLDAMIAAHPYHNVIVSTHGYLNVKGNVISTQGTEDKFDAVIKKHANVVMVLCGHVRTQKVESWQVLGDNGNVITRMLIDPTYYDFNEGTKKDTVHFPGGAGMIANLRFSENGSKVSVSWYSTVQEKYYNSKSVYTLQINTIARKQIKTEVNGNGGEIITNRMDIVGEPIQITATPKQNHHLTKLTVGGVDVTADVVNGVYTLATDENTADGLLVLAEFAEDAKYAVTLQNEDDKGIITTNTSATEHFAGTELTWKITAKSGWKVAGVTLNGTALEKNSDGEYSGVVESSQNVLSVQYEEVAMATTQNVVAPSSTTTIVSVVCFFALGLVLSLGGGIAYTMTKKRRK